MPGNKKISIEKTKNTEMMHTKKAVPACFVAKRKNINRKPSPLVGEGVSEADGRGKREQKRKNSFL